MVPFPISRAWASQIEIEKVRKRREEREAEKARMEEEAAYLNRERAVAEGIELEKKEELVCWTLAQSPRRTPFVHMHEVHPLYCVRTFAIPDVALHFDKSASHPEPNSEPQHRPCPWFAPYPCPNPYHHVIDPRTLTLVDMKPGCSSDAADPSTCQPLLRSSTWSRRRCGRGSACGRVERRPAT